MFARMVSVLVHAPAEPHNVLGVPCLHVIRKASGMFLLSVHMSVPTEVA